jgi:NhaB family Na+:H+ antiporter
MASVLKQDTISRGTVKSEPIAFNIEDMQSRARDYLLEMQGQAQLVGFYVANGLLSMVSDNVFVATVYITEIQSAFEAGRITREQFELLAVAINTGTNIPSIATPNGQAAFLFLLTSGVAPLIRLSYGRMVLLALPYTITMSTTGLLATLYLLG